jgi:hypothetical protein
MSGRVARLSDLPVIDERGLRDGTAPGVAPARTSILVEAGELLLMPAASHRYADVKLASVAPDNVNLGLPGSRASTWCSTAALDQLVQAAERLR